MPTTYPVYLSDDRAIAVFGVGCFVGWFLAKQIFGNHRSLFVWALVTGLVLMGSLSSRCYADSGITGFSLYGSTTGNSGQGHFMTDNNLMTGCTFIPDGPALSFDTYIQQGGFIQLQPAGLGDVRYIHCVVQLKQTSDANYFMVVTLANGNAYTWYPLPSAYGNTTNHQAISYGAVDAAGVTPDTVNLGVGDTPHGGVANVVQVGWEWSNSMTLAPTTAPATTTQPSPGNSQKDPSFASDIADTLFGPASDSSDPERSGGMISDLRSTAVLDAKYSFIATLPGGGSPSSDPGTDLRIVLDAAAQPGSGAFSHLNAKAENAGKFGEWFESGWFQGDILSYVDVLFANWLSLKSNYSWLFTTIRTGAGIWFGWNFIIYMVDFICWSIGWQDRGWLLWLQLAWPAMGGPSNMDDDERAEWAGDGDEGGDGDAIEEGVGMADEAEDAIAAEDRREDLRVLKGHIRAGAGYRGDGETGSEENSVHDNTSDGMGSD